MKATSLAYQRFGQNQCGLGLLLSRGRKLTASSRLTTNTQAVSHLNAEWAWKTKRRNPFLPVF
jgi:hypothetical protein